MIKTGATIMAVLMFLIFFHPNIKGVIVEYQVRAVISGLDADTDTMEQLRDIADRLNDGYARRQFTDVEKDTIVTLRYDLRELRKKETETDEQKLQVENAAKRIAAKFEAILKRHNL